MATKKEAAANEQEQTNTAAGEAQAADPKAEYDKIIAKAKAEAEQILADAKAQVAQAEAPAPSPAVDRSCLLYTSGDGPDRAQPGPAGRHGRLPGPGACHRQAGAGENAGAERRKKT